MQYSSSRGPELTRGFPDLWGHYFAEWGTLEPWPIYIDEGVGHHGAPTFPVAITPPWGVYALWESSPSNYNLPLFIGSIGHLRRTKGISQTVDSRDLRSYSDKRTAYKTLPILCINVPQGISPRGLKKILLQGCANHFLDLPKLNPQV